MSGAAIALIVVVALVVMGGGGCLVCAVLVSMGSTTNAADATAPTTENERTIGRTPIAVKLEGALRNDGIPFDHIECPLHPPASGSFSCAVYPGNEGDPAEVTVTNGPNGMSYKLQEGFVVLDGAKLTSTFAGIAKRMGAPQMTVPCFRGKILKHADTSFTCDVQSGGVVVGHVTTNVVGPSGDVKMDYQPLARANPSPSPSPSPSPPSSLDGTYACSMMARQGNGVQYVPAALPPFTISGGSYTSGGKIGMIRTSGSNVVLFLDGAYDGWQGLLGTSPTTRSIVFRGRDHTEARPGVGVSVGDYQCSLQK